MDILISFPLLILALAVVTALGNNDTNVIVAITIPIIPRVCPCDSLQRAIDSTHAVY
jgi:ABC-type dipeptide/oligopeptide/nickel transport system permease subunit